MLCGVLGELVRRSAQLSDGRTENTGTRALRHALGERQGRTRATSGRTQRCSSATWLATSQTFFSRKALVPSSTLAVSRESSLPRAPPPVAF